MNNKLNSFVLKYGRIIDPGSGLDKITDIRVENGRISEIGDNLKSLNEVYCDDKWVLPGFVDLHCHLRDMFEWKKGTIKTETLAAVKGGYTTVCCMPNTKPCLDNSLVLKYYKYLINKHAQCRVHVIGPFTQGLKQHTPMSEVYLKDLCVGYSNDGCDTPCKQLKQNLFKLQDQKVIISHTCNVDESSKIAQEIELLRSNPYNINLHFTHISKKGSLELIYQGKEEGLNITCDVTPHHLYPIEYNWKVKPVSNTYEDYNSLRNELIKGLVDCVVTDHAPHESERFPGVSGFETAFSLVYSLFKDVEPLQLVSWFTSNPATILRTSMIGDLSCGSIADIVVFDPNREWVIDKEEFVSKGKNTPFDGEEVLGKVEKTFVNGRLVYND